MTKITEIDRKLQVKHLNDLSKASLKSNIKHSQNIQKQIDHTIVLTKIIQEDRAKISRLENVIDMKQREVDELNKKNTDLLWEAGKLQVRNGKLQEYKDNNEKQLAYYEKSLKNMIRNKKDN
jgi:FtsZ-binding cell division protein ZapB